MKKVFIDSDVIMDLLLKREPFFEDAFNLFFYIPRLKIKAYTIPIVFSNVIYAAQKFYARKRIVQRLQSLRKFIEIIEVNSHVFDQALISGFSDLEDAMQYFAAKEAKLNCIITRNIKDYKKSSIPVLSPREYLTRMLKY